MSNEQEKVCVISHELKSVKKFIKQREYLPLPLAGGREKNVSDSIKYRQKGNELYKSKNHNEKIHEQIWRTYTQSIALAPNKSEELACGYGNRSALLFHLEKFKDCIKDCDKALSVTKSDVLKTKILTRKAESLFLLDKLTAEDVAKEALQFLEKLHLEFEAVKPYDEKLKNILSNCNRLKGKKKNHNKKLRKTYINQLSDFPRSEEVPCASKSVAIQYNKNFGRHLVATEDMRPGEIFALEKNYYTFFSQEGMYLYCSNCAKSAWSSIPCEYCIYDVYCSESCRSEAWKKYHQWECAVYPYIWDIDKEKSSCQFIMRFAFTAINEVGGIANMKKLLIELDECKDPRTAGFSEGVFDLKSVRSVYSISKYKKTYNPFLEQKLIQEFCVGAYLLAKHTTFFGSKMNVSVFEVFKNKEVLLFAALLLHSYHAINLNAHHQVSSRNNILAVYATILRPFLSLVIHNCDPNVKIVMAKHNTTVAYAIKPIKKGTQLAISYLGRNFLEEPKELRQEFLRNYYKFTCKCLACTENWSNICLPKLEMNHKLTPDLKKTLLEIANRLKKVKLETEFFYSSKMMRDIVFFLDSVGTKITPHCDMYQGCLECLNKMFSDVFGSFQATIPEQCFTN